MSFIQNINTMLTYIEKNLFGNIKINKLAQFLNTNQNELTRLFPIVFNIGLQEYIKKRKLSKAFDMLKTKSVMEVSLICGYKSYAAFSRAFKKQHNVLPSKIKTAKPNIYPILYLK